MLRADPRLSRVFLAASLVLVGASPALAAGADYFLKLGGVDGDTKGKARDRHKDEIEILSYSFGASQAAKVSKVDAISIKQTSVQGADGNGQADALTDGLMILRNTNEAPKGGVSVAAGDVTGDGKPAASGLPTSKRQHKPFAVTKPLNSGSIMLKGSFAACSVGAAYPLIEVGGRGKGYKLTNVQVVDCGNGTMTANYDGLLIVRY